MIDRHICCMICAILLYSSKKKNKYLLRMYLYSDLTPLLIICVIVIAFNTIRRAQHRLKKKRNSLNTKLSIFF